MMEQLSKTVTKEVTAGLAGVAEQFASSIASMQKDNSQDGDTHDRFHARSQSEFRDTRPTISDDDPNIEDYDMLFDTMIETWSAEGGNPVLSTSCTCMGNAFLMGRRGTRCTKTMSESP